MKTILLLIAAAMPVAADTEFRAGRMTRGDVPFGKGQCDIRLRIDDEGQVRVRGDRVWVRTVSGREGRDEGSQCNQPLPDRGIKAFHFEVLDGRGDIFLLSPPYAGNGYTAVVRIRDSAGGSGCYPFRLSWIIDGRGATRHHAFGEAGARRGVRRAGFAFVCAVDLDSGRVRSVDVRKH